MWLVALVSTCLALDLPPELRGSDRRSTSQLALRTRAAENPEKPRIRVSTASQQFLSSYARGPIQIVFCSFKAFFNTPVKVSGYIDPEWNELPMFTSQSRIDAASPTMNRTEFTMRLCTFFGCVGVNGGALQITIPCRIYSCTFTRCSTTVSNGGVIWFDPGTPSGMLNYRLLINSCTFSDCSGGGYGGSVYAANGVLQLFRDEFLISKAAEGGAFYYIQGEATGPLYILSCMFYQCTAGTGLEQQVFYAEMNLKSNREVHLDFCRFSNQLPDGITELNQQEFNGTGVWLLKDPQVTSITLFRNRFGTTIEAVHQTPTYTFSPTPSQSPTASPTASPPPTATPTPTPTDTFTQSDSFSPSASFTPTPTASIYVPTSQPTSLPSASQSPWPTISVPPATASPSQSPWATATASASPSISQSPMASATASISKSPPITWAGLSLGLIIFACLLLLAGIIANIIMCAVCCRPEEVLAKQYV